MGLEVEIRSPFACERNGVTPKQYFEWRNDRVANRFPGCFIHQHYRFSNDLKLFRYGKRKLGDDLVSVAIDD
jgi:hypothetical protein